MAENTKPEVIPCALLPETRERIEKYAAELKAAAPSIGTHGLPEGEFWSSGIFQSAIERLRGSQAASMSVKRDFLEEVLGYMNASGAIANYFFTGGGDRHDYQIEMHGGHRAVFEAKGCLDGNNTTIFQRPANADEFFIWSLCQNSGADPRHNAWSGIHTRLGGAILAESQRVDALVIWDMLCGTLARPCPKLLTAGRATKLASGRSVPPPCIYLFPRTKPDARNNQQPAVWRLEELPFINALARCFRCLPEEIVEVHIHTRMKEADVQRKTKLVRAGSTLIESNWTTLKRASR
ncbi:MAG: hypothetical protein AB1705_01135 [Verrucomicrobiota bacterium]